MWTLLLFLSCIGPSPDPVDPTNPTDPTDPVEPTDPTNPPDPVDPATPGEPFVVEHRNEGGMVYHDAFTFWGWSSDGARYAYETFHPGEGAIECEGEAELTVVDAATDSYAPEGQLSVKVAGEVGPCEPPDARAAIAKDRDAHLARFEIRPGLAATPIALSGDGPWTFSTPDGRTYTLTVEVKGPGWDNPEEGAGFVGTLSREGGGRVVFEDGTTLRPWQFGYHPRRVFLSPDGQRAALVIDKEGMAFEGRRFKPMTSAVQLSAL